VILLELNEINFEFVRRYIERGSLPAFRELLDKHGYVETTSEQRYEEIEPWIQWVTAHTGLSLREHGVFRLGDITKTDIPQIWEQLEEQLGTRIGAVSPMNAVNRLKRPAFFVPDPWTRTATSGSWLLRKLSAAISQAVNDNAQARLGLGPALALIAGWLAYAAPSEWPRYLQLAATARKAPWRRAVFLDMLLSDVFVREWRRTRPAFSSLFLNAGAHIQHHYMFSSACYDGPHRNPDWYIDEGQDPLLEIYESYDRLLSRTLRLPGNPRLLIATGLHQDPHDELTYYWRLRNHAAFLSEAGLDFVSVTPLMSRDFTITCKTGEHAAAIEQALLGARVNESEPAFSVDNRGTDLFVMLEYPHDIPADTPLMINGKTFANFRADVSFVAIKNGKHNGVGYLIDTGSSPRTAVEQIPLKTLPELIRDAVHA
jgi:hypothetical protein